jgi:alkanesulfonate monooxygenase SsuD/methylene tetrahydromethanopterin reductase-like flavin-dependent oxidoreductase (luciferase family)
MVSPVSFRQPTMTVRMASAVDDLSNGRLHLGLGAGWQEREHRNYGWDLLDVKSRMDRFEEGLEVISRLLHSDEPVDFAGEYFRVQEAILLPRPQRPGGPPILIGGNGPRRTLPLVAKYADEWNAVFLAPEGVRQRNEQLDTLLRENSRQPGDVRRSLMTGCIFGRDEAEVKRKLEPRNVTYEELRQEARLAVGTGNQIVEQLGRWAEAGIYRVMLQWLDLDDLDGLEAMAKSVLPQVG